MVEPVIVSVPPAVIAPLVVIVPAIPGDTPTPKALQLRDALLAVMVAPVIVSVAPVINPVVVIVPALPRVAPFKAIAVQVRLELDAIIAPLLIVRPVAPVINPPALIVPLVIAPQARVDVPALIAPPPVIVVVPVELILTQLRLELVAVIGPLLIVSPPEIVKRVEIVRLGVVRLVQLIAPRLESDSEEPEVIVKLEHVNGPAIVNPLQFNTPEGVIETPPPTRLVPLLLQNETPAVEFIVNAPDVP
jgi:hypothetical protein